MADLSVKPIGLDIKPMPTMSLGEMINFARGAQEYQKGGITLEREQIEQRERKNIMEFLSRPENYQTGGRVDIDKLNAEITKIAPLTGAKYLTEFTGLSTAQSGAEEAGIKLSVEQKTNEERKRLANLMLNPQALMTPQGTWDLDKIHEEVYKIAPLSGTDFIKNLTGLSTAQIENKKAALGLDLEQKKNQQREALRNTLTKDPGQILTDGRLDPVKVNQLALKIAPDLSPELISSLTASATGQFQAGTSQIALTLEQQKENERKAYDQFTKSQDGLVKFQTPQGLNLDALRNYMLEKFPLTGADRMAQISTLETAGSQAQKAAQDLTQDQRAIVAQTLGVLGRAGVNDKNAYLQALGELEKQNPNNPRLKSLLDAYKTTVNNLPADTNLSEIAVRASNSLLSATQQQEKFAPQVGTVSTGAATYVTTTKPSIAGETPTVFVAEKPLVTAQLPPGQREVPTGRLDTTNKPTFYRYGFDGSYLGEFTSSGTPVQPPNDQRPVVTSQALAAEPVARLRPGETVETMTAANNLRKNAQDAAQQVPNQIFNNNKIIELADKVITGKGADFVGSLSGGYALLPWTTDNAKNLNELGHFMQLQTASLSQSSGLGGTDAGRSIAGEIAGKKDWTADAIKSTARINRALSTATKLFNDGMQKEFGKTNDPFSVRDFQNKWTKTVDINAVRLYDAMINKDNEAISEIEKQFGGMGSKEYKALRDKTVKLQKLVRGQ